MPLNYTLRKSINSDNFKIEKIINVLILILIILINKNIFNF